MDFNVFMPISKVDKEQRMVYGYASTSTKDLQGEIVSLDALKAALPDYMEWAPIREMHTTSAVGVTKEANVDSKGLYIKAKIRDDAAWAKCIESEPGAGDQVYKGFSIGGSKLEKQGDTIKALRLTEISLVDRPANGDCRFDVSKSLIKVGEENQGSNASLIEKALDTLKSIVGQFSPSPAPVLELVPNIEKSDALTADEISALARKFDEVEFEKREFSEKERKHLASTGAALPDGSFPISSAKDVENAVKAHGRAGDPEKAKAHIIARAKELKATHLLPADWPGSTKTKESTIMDSDIQKRHSAAHKEAIAKAAGHLHKAMEHHAAAVSAHNELVKCFGKADGIGTAEHHKHLGKLTEHLGAMGEHHELAEHYLRKAAGSSEAEHLPDDDTPNAEALRPLPQSRFVSGGKDDTVSDNPYTAAAVADMVKAAVAEATAPLVAETAFMKGQLSIIEKQPGGAARPKLYSGVFEQPGATNGKVNFDREINKAASSVDLNDPNSCRAAAARAIGLMNMKDSPYCKSVDDPGFQIDFGS